nr:hypothetical protein CFP56_56522 [Quercus suber]
MALSLAAPLVLLLAQPLLTTAQQQPVLSAIPFIGYDINSPIDASIIGVQDSVTTMSLACAAGTDASDCGLAPVQALIYGPGTYLMAMSDGSDFTATQDCMISGTTAPATCTEFATGPAANDPGMSTTTYDATDVALVSVTVTGGADLLSAGTGAASTSAETAALTTLTGASSTATTAAASSGTAMTPISTMPTQSASSASVTVASTTSDGFAAGPLAPRVGGVAEFLTTDLSSMTMPPDQCTLKILTQVAADPSRPDVCRLKKSINLAPALATVEGVAAGSHCVLRL